MRMWTQQPFTTLRLPVSEVSDVVVRESRRAGHQTVQARTGRPHRDTADNRRDPNPKSVSPLVSSDSLPGRPSEETMRSVDRDSCASVWLAVFFSHVGTASGWGGQ